MAQIHDERLRKLQAEMRRAQIDGIVLGNSPNLYYMTGYAPKKCERLLAAILPADGAPALIVPAIYRFSSERECSIASQSVWLDGEDLVKLVGGILCEMGLQNGRIAIDDTLEFHQFSLFKAASPRSEFSLGSRLMTPLRMRKSPDELEWMRRSGAIADRAIEWVINAIRANAGKSERQLRAELSLWSVGLGMPDGCSSLIASGVHSASPHHIPTDRVPAPGDAVWVDLGGGLSHYYSDITRSFFIGTPPERYRTLYAHVKEAQQRAFESIRPGIRACDVHKVAWDYLDKQGLSALFTHRLGHGIGLEGHEQPNLAPDSEIILEPGMTFSCEPGCYDPDAGYGIRIEDSVAVTETGAESFNHFTKELIVID